MSTSNVNLSKKYRKLTKYSYINIDNYTEGENKKKITGKNNFSAPRITPKHKRVHFAESHRKLKQTA